MADVNISYKGNTISELNESGIKRLKTKGKYCEDDISIEYAGVSKKGELWEGVNFIDYDGTIIETWTPQEVESKTELPIPPQHEYLINDGWNWSLSSIKEYMLNYPDAYLSVGAQYKTVDRATYLFVNIDKFTLNPCVSFQINGTAVIDWGDGTTNEVSGTSNTSNRIDTQHTYSSSGKYIIKITSDKPIYLVITTGNPYTPGIFWSGIDYKSSIKYVNCLKSVFLGNSALHYLALFYAYGLETVVISSDVVYVNNNSFSSGKIKTFVVPKQITNIISTALMSQYFIKLSLPDTMTAYSLPSQCSISGLSLPPSIKSIGVYNSNTNYWLSKLTIPKNANITSFDNYAFLNAVALNNINIPQSVTSIGVQCFGNCPSLSEIHFYPITPPTVSNSNAFGDVPTTCKIYVPKGTLELYTSATNYPDPSVYTYIEE